ncbi:MAG: ribosome silencing factor [Lachnospiraceae bacterium]|nr:ribosome silencing factor [Lachnospiraceae bacterium]
MSKEIAKEMARLAYKALDDKKGEDIAVIDIGGVSVLADYFIIAAGSNVNQVQAMADNVDQELGKAGYACKQMEGYQAGQWILLDFGDIVVHVFSRDDRRFYNLERIWRDGKFLSREDLD